MQMKHCLSCQRKQFMFTNWMDVHGLWMQHKLWSVSIILLTPSCVAIPQVFWGEGRIGWGQQWLTGVRNVCATRFCGSIPLYCRNRGKVCWLRVCKLDHFCCFDVFCSSVLSSFFVVIGSLPLCCEVERWDECGVCVCMCICMCRMLILKYRLELESWELER